jgi:hypothetical protein
MMKRNLIVSALGIIVILTYSQQPQDDREDPFIWLDELEGEKARFWI